MTQDELKKFEPFWDKWYLEERLGGGSFGDVYRIKRKEYGAVYYAALKVISIPKDRAELNEIALSCGSNEQTRTYFDNIRQTIVNEINIMERLKGKTNIVNYEDHDILPKNHGKEPGYDIFIRMELLEDLRTVGAKNPVLLRDPSEVARIGLDICEALKLCHAQHIIHRDIKQANIFRSQDGDYKLGDFGIARNLTNNQMTMSIKGTYEYMAPEVYNREHYDFRSDIYSLGMVLYHLLNGFRGPFLEEVSGVPTVDQREKALLLRMRGEPFVKPQFAGDRLSEIIIKACAFHKEDRYADIEEMKEALLQLQPLDLEPVGPDRRKETPSEEEDCTVILNQMNKGGELAAEPSQMEDWEDAEKMQTGLEQDDALPLVNLQEEGTIAFQTPPEAAALPLETHSAEAEPIPIPEPMEVPVSNRPACSRKKVLPGAIMIAAATLAAVIIVAVTRLNTNSDGNIPTEVQQAEKEAGRKRNSQDQKKEKSQAEEPVSVVTPICKEGVSAQSKEAKERYPKGIYVGDAWNDIELKGLFQPSDTDNTEIPGKFEWEEEGKIKESGEYHWVFIPEDTSRYKTVTGTLYITAIIEDTVKGLDALQRVKDRKALRDVDLSGCKLDDLSVLEGAVNLTYLQLDHNNLENLSVLAKCKKLKFISLNHNPNLSDVSAILKLKHLDTVFLDGTKVSDEDSNRVNQICAQK